MISCGIFNLVSIGGLQRLTNLKFYEHFWGGIVFPWFFDKACKTPGDAALPSSFCITSQHFLLSLPLSPLPPQWAIRELGTHCAHLHKEGLLNILPCPDSTYFYPLSTGLLQDSGITTGDHFLFSPGRRGVPFICLYGILCITTMITGTIHYNNYWLSSLYHYKLLQSKGSIFRLHIPSVWHIFPE